MSWSWAIYGSSRMSKDEVKEGEEAHGHEGLEHLDEGDREVQVRGVAEPQCACIIRVLRMIRAFYI